MDEKLQIDYLKGLNKDLVKEVMNLDMMLTRTKIKLNKKQRLSKLQNNLHELIAQTNDTNNFYKNIAEQINVHLDMEATFIYKSSNRDAEYKLTSYSVHHAINEQTLKELEKLSLDDWPVFVDYLLVNQLNKENEQLGHLKKKFQLSSFIVYKVSYSLKEDLILVTGNNIIDDIGIRDLNIDDVHNLEAVGILISSYQRKLELFQLNEIDRIKTEFVANLSHEFRTPLTLVLGLLDEMSMNKYFQDSREEHEKLEIVLKNAHRINELIGQLLDITKLETKIEQILAQNSNLNYFLSDIEKSFRVLAKQNAIEFSCQFPKEQHETWFDPDKLEKIITNLLTNAFKYCGENGKVLFIVSFIGSPISGIEIRVLDNGLGIPPEERDKIFDKYYRINNQQSSQKTGSGVGLYLVKKLVVLHKGHLELFVTKNWTEFVVKIPIHKTAYLVQESVFTDALQIKTNNARETTKSENYKQHHVLLVEDNRELNSFIQSSLSEVVKVTCAYDGRSGFEMAKTTVPDLIVSDVMMPKMNGIELCNQLKHDALTQHIPIILLTAKADYESKIEGLASGADDYISKPFDMHELKLKIRNHIETSNRQKQHLCQEIFTAPELSNDNIPNDHFLKEVIALMKANIDNANFGINDVCRTLFISRTQLYRKIEALTGQKPACLLRLLRIKTAAELFRQGYKNVAEVMYQVGFNNQSNFATNFRKQYHMNPSHYINKFNSL